MEPPMGLFLCYVSSMILPGMLIKVAAKERVHLLYTWNLGMLIFLSSLI
uniref:Uncharacterized protein n=1 Tax=Arundo donax TaxID=35708 RepID=A0A0A9GBX5_ARUDO